MKKMQSKFLFVADDPCLDFLNTQMILKGNPVDTLETFGDLVSWIQESSIETVSDFSVQKLDGKPEAARALSEAKRFREMLRDMVVKLIEGKRVPDSTFQQINLYMSRMEAHPVLLRDKNRFVKRSQNTIDSPMDLLAPIAEAAANLLSTADYSLIHKCENDRCILYFYDTTRNHARRWCSMKACGNRHKAATHYQKTRNKNA